MKKRNLLVALVMAIVMLMTGCGAEEKVNPFVGKWIGTLDLTDYVIQSMVAEDATMEKYAKFENLTFTFVFEFTEEKVSLHVDKTSITQFLTNIETGVVNIVDAMVADVAAENDMTAEDVYAGMNVTREEYIAAVIDDMKLDVMVNTMAEALELNGSYESDEEKIVVVYEDNTYEEMKYAFNGEKLLITVSNGTNDFAIECTKAE